MRPTPPRSDVDLGALAEVLASPIRVVKGLPDDVELAALVASILSARAAPGEDDGSGSSVWADPARRWGVPPTPGRAAWRWSSHQGW